MLAEFSRLAGGREARIVVIPTAPSSIRFGPENTILNPDDSPERPEWVKYRSFLRASLGTEQVALLHTRDRRVAGLPKFLEAIRGATGVYIPGGNAGRLAAAYLGTPVVDELRALLDRGGVILGSSAGAIILGSFLVRGRPDKPLLMAEGHTTGFGLLGNVAINPHLTSAKRDSELINVCDAHPELLGIGIDDDAAIVVRGNRFEVIGTGRVAVYDNTKRNGSWYSLLGAGRSFDLAEWTAEPELR